MISFAIDRKTDLENEIKVAFADAKQLSDTWGIEYIETSTKANFNCKESFERLAQKIVALKKDDGGNTKCGCNIF